MQAKQPKVEIKDGVLYVLPTGDHKETLIWLHGLGDTGHGFLDFFASGMLQPNTTKVVLPTAPQRKVTVNMGFESTSWFDIRSFNIDPINFPQAVAINEVQDSTEIVTRLIEQEVKLLGGNYSRIILGGFSQGACMSLHIGLQFPHRLAGIIALSGFLFPTTVISEVNKDTPIYIAHGELDPVIRWQLAKVSYERLKAAEKERTMFALNVESKGGHEVGQMTLFQIKEFFTIILKA